MAFVISASVYIYISMYTRVTWLYPLQAQQSRRHRRRHSDSVKSRLDPSHGVQCTERFHPGELAVLGAPRHVLHAATTRLPRSRECLRAPPQRLIVACARFRPAAIRFAMYRSPVITIKRRRSVQSCQ